MSYKNEIQKCNIRENRIADKKNLRTTASVSFFSFYSLKVSRMMIAFVFVLNEWLSNTYIEKQSRLIEEFCPNWEDGEQKFGKFET